MFKKNFVATTLALMGACSGSALGAVVGGGAAEPLYNTPTVLASGFNPYIATSSGAAKQALFTNDATKLGLAAGITVDYAGSDSILSASEISTYQAAHQSPAVPVTSAANWGPLVQVPSAATSVTIPYKLTLAGGAALNNLDLTSAQLCDIFSGTITTWNQVNASYPATAITVVYRAGSSGTTEIFTRHLNSQCSAKFTTNSTFTTANVGAEPASWIAATGSANLASTVASTEGAIGYVGPENVDATNNAVVAKVNGLLPAIGNVTTVLSTIAPPSTAADRAAPSKWAPVLANPSSGYKIIGYTFLVFSQCYKDLTDRDAIRDVVQRHYHVSDALNNDDEIIANNLIPLADNWKVAIRSTFYNPPSSLAIGNTAACNSIGRPL